MDCVHFFDLMNLQSLLEFIIVLDLTPAAFIQRK